ncbi:MAG: hypothetical protein DRR08_08815 [Candidatus Parabeggiatoa sp. nov. 2]|nr:MAG: hypothetical protein DRR08_08815 [Gammaproteobacteria bacterium]
MAVPIKSSKLTNARAKINLELLPRFIDDSGTVRLFFQSDLGAIKRFGKFQIKVWPSNAQ